ncbi:nuclear transport factor 2 family protein [Spirosoma sp.]|uniref:nuclear transport factor 2 family protein n=1 Tax=Spirosoma sp. TaxID=1899569 RepID=UPI003B3BC58C
MKTLLTLCLIATLQLAQAQAPKSAASGAIVPTPERIASLSAEEKAVLAIEKQRFDAQVKKDYATLERVLADDLIYTHSNANTDTKKSFIQSIRDGKSRYDAVKIEQQNVRIYGHTAVINGTCMIKAMNNGQSINTHIKYTDVYVRNGNQWQLVAWQSLKLPN